MLDKLKAAYNRVLQWCRDSETLLWQRVKVIAGMIGGLVIYAINDPSINSAIQSLLKPAYLPFYLVAGGLFCEFLRRHRAEDL